MKHINLSDILKIPKSRIDLLFAGMIFVYVTVVILEILIFGSVPGRWYYPYYRHIQPEVILVSATFLSITMLLYYATIRFLKSRWNLVIVLWLIWGLLFQISAYSLAPVPIAEAIRSEGSNPYYSVSRSHTATDILMNFESIAAVSQIHIRSNMPGKLLLYSALNILSGKPDLIGYMIVVISSIGGGILVYTLTTMMFTNRIVSLYAMMLYMIIPSRNYFSPLLNTVSPLASMMSLIILLRVLRRPSVLYALLYGVSIIVMILMEPMLLVTCVIHGFIILEYIITRKCGVLTICKLLSYALIGYLSTNLLILYLFNFDVIARYIYMVEDAKMFNRISFRGYRHWIAFNITDLFFAAGMPAVIVWLIYSLGTIWTLTKRLIKRINVPIEHISATLFSLGVLSMLIGTEFLGIARGETQRLWIFIMVFIQIGAAYAFVKIYPEKTFVFALICTIIQTLVTVNMVRFL
jgi:hypothetical protein